MLVFFFYNCTFITLNFIMPVLVKYSRVMVFKTLLYSNTSEILILYSTRVTIFTSIFYSTRVVKFQYLPNTANCLPFGEKPFYCSRHLKCLFVHIDSTWIY